MKEKEEKNAFRRRNRVKLVCFLTNLKIVLSVSEWQ